MIPIGICRYLVLLICLSTWVNLTDSKEVRVVCYYTNWSIYRPGQAKFSPQNINPYLCTHLIYAFGGFTKENTLKPFDKYQDIEKGGYAKFTGLKTYNKNLKTLIAIGGWNEGSSRFSPMVASPDRRKELVRNAIKFLRQNHFDGLDLDWEYPSFRDGGKPRDRDNYAHLVKELREEFERESEKTGRPRLLLTMAVPAGIEYINKGYDVPKLTKYLDWMNILSYDYHSAFEPAVNHHAPLYSLEEDNEYNYDGELTIDYTIKHYLKLGADPKKLVLGIPTYGRSYTLFNPDSYELGSPADGPGDMGEATRENGYLAYYEICEYVKNQDWEVEEPNSKAMGPIAFKDNQWVGYDDENIVREKARYVADNDLGGIMFWAIDNDDFRGNCHGKPYPLIEAGREALIDAYGLTDENLVSPPKKPSKTRTRPSKKTTTTTEDPEDSSSSTAPTRRRRIKNKSRQEDSDSGGKRTSTYSSLKVVTPAYTTPAPPATPDMDGAFKCEEDGFFPHPKDCKKYFWCLSGPGDTGIVAHAFTCPAGLYFNKAADSCDYSQNVLCNKKLQKSTTSTTIKPEENEVSSTDPSSTFIPSSIVSRLFTTQRVPPKITAATSKTTIDLRRTTTTTEATEEEYEYDDEEDVEKSIDKKSDLEEDPRVIKELIDLIRKAGGIEELERQLQFGKVGVSSTDTTTPSAISKSLYERVLSKANKKALVGRKSPSNVNSGGPQKAEAEEKNIGRKTPQYQVLSRQRSTTEEPTEQVAATIATEKTKVQKRPSFRTKSTLEYKKITRPKVNLDSEDDQNEESDQEENKEFASANENRSNPRRNNIPQYVNIRRPRPSTTESTLYSESASLTDFEDEEDANDTRTNFIRRGSTTEASTLKERTSSRYQTIRRSTTQASTLSTQDEDSSRYQTIRRSTTPATAPITQDEEIFRKQTAASTPESKYIVIQRSTTSESPPVDTETTERYQTNLRESSSYQNSQSTERPESTDSVDFTTEAYTEIISKETTLSTSSLSSLTTEHVPITTLNVETESKSSASTSTSNFQDKPKRKPLISYKPFATTSYSNPESTTEISKVSQPSFRFRSRATTSSPFETSSTVRSRTRVRITNNNRNLSEDTEQQDKYDRTVIKPIRTRKRIILSTEPSVDLNEEYERKYRPADLADLSSLTAVDLGIRGGEFVSQHRRRRPTTVASTTTLVSASRLENYGSRSIASKHQDTDPNTNEVSTTRKTLRPFRSSTPKYSAADKTNAASGISSSPSSTLRTRRIIRKFRPTSEQTFTTDASKDKQSISTAKPLKRVRASFVRRTPDLKTNLERIDIPSDLEHRNDALLEEDEDENINLSESNIRESSHINTFEFNEKPARKLNAFKNSGINKPTSTTESDIGDDDEVQETTDDLQDFQTSSSTESYESTKLFRTRKIVRKFTTPLSTTTTESTTEPFDLGKKRKVVRRLRPSRFRDNKPVIDQEKLADKALLKTESSIAKQSNFRRNFLFNQHKPNVDRDPVPSDSVTDYVEKEKYEEHDVEQGKGKKFTIFSSSVERKHQFESRTVFNDEDEDDEDRITKKNNTIVSHIIKSAENTREESTTVMDVLDDSDDDDHVTTEMVNDLETTIPDLGTIPFEDSTENYFESTDTASETTELNTVNTMQLDLDASIETATVLVDDNKTSDSSNGIGTLNHQYVSSTQVDSEVTPKYKRPSLLSRLKERRNEFRSRSTISTEVEVSSTKNPTRTYGAARKSPYIKDSLDKPRRLPSYRYRSTEKPVEDAEKESKIAEDHGILVENDEEGLDVKEIDDKNIIEGTRLSFKRPSTTPKAVDLYFGAERVKKNTTSTETVLTVDAEVVKNRNRNLFARRKTNSPVITSFSTSVTQPSEEIEIDDITSVTTTSSTQGDSTEPNLTTLHHVFAEIKDEDETTTESMSPPTKQSTGKLERLIEVNRIVEVNTKQVKNHTGEVEIVPTFDKIGEISRITYIKVVDGDNVTIIKDPELNRNITLMDYPIFKSEDNLEEVEAQVNEIPSVNQNVRLADFKFKVENDLNNEREDRKFNIFEGSKIANSKDESIVAKPDIIDGISQINVVTPKPVLFIESSTIALQGLFQTENSRLNPSFTLNDELLESERSEFVNVRVLNKDRDNIEGRPFLNPVRIASQNEDHTVKAHVMEIPARPDSKTIKIVPITVQMSRSLISTHSFKSSAKH